MKKLFENETAIISGGLGDIGREIALEFARNGANVALGDIRPASDAVKFLGSLDELGILCSYTQVDVADPVAVDNWVSDVESQIGVASYIIVNAAIVTVEGIQTLSAEKWSRELRINLDGAFHMSQAASRRLLHHQRAGRIVFIGSWAAHSVHTNIPAYCVAKAGVRMLCKCLALELAPFNILVNELAPGFVDAGLSGRMFEKDPQLRLSSQEKVPVKKLIRAEEVAAQTVLMCHPQNQHMTGATILMDGGLSLLT